MDNQVYFITARCRERYPAFAHARAKAAFWDRLEHYALEAGLVLWIVSLMVNHYHLIGYNRRAEALRVMMQRVRRRGRA